MYSENKRVGFLRRMDEWKDANMPPCGASGSPSNSDLPLAKGPIQCQSREMLAPLSEDTICFFTR